MRQPARARREAAAWCQQQKLAYFETHPSERPLPKILVHLANSLVLRGDDEEA